MTQPKAPVCYKCKHFYETSPMDLTCSAFPERIPDRIINGFSQHKTPITGDSGIVYEEIEGDPSDIVGQ